MLAAWQTQSLSMEDIQFFKQEFNDLVLKRTMKMDGLYGRPSVRKTN
jgi:hypothetical protein